MPTLIDDSEPELTPVSAVETSSDVGGGTTVFRLTLKTSVLAVGNVVQVEYLVTAGEDLDTHDNKVENDFISLDHIQGLPISQQDMDNNVTVYLNVPVPILASNEPTDNHIRFRVYIGATETHVIRVTDWSNAAPFKPPPLQPPTPIAFLIRNDTAENYNYSDQLYVQIPPQEVSYDLEVTKFIVSYNYRDIHNDVQWVVSSPLVGSLPYTNGNILLDPISLPNDMDVSWTNANVPHVAVNAILEYEISGVNYYTVSEISVTVNASEVTINDIKPTISGLVYDTAAQTMTVTWNPPTVQNIPNYQVDSYKVIVKYANPNNVNQLITEEYDPVDLFTYTYTIPTSLIDAGTTSTTISFAVQAIPVSGEAAESDQVSRNTFTFASAPQQLSVVWATGGHDDTVDTVDMLISFANPSNIGQGSNPNLTLQVFDDDGNVVKSETVAYGSGDGLYSILLDDVRTTTTGSVKVFMTTKDTNSDNRLDGAESSAATYTSVDVPIIIELSRDEGNDNLLAAVVSRVPLVRLNKLKTVSFNPFKYTPVYFIVNVDTQNPTETITDEEGASYVVTLTALFGGVFQYDFVFSNEFLSNADIPIGGFITLIVANSTGVASRPLPSE